jgi:hypothetical protein
MKKLVLEVTVEQAGRKPPFFRGTWDAKEMPKPKRRK